MRLSCCNLGDRGAIKRLMEIFVASLFEVDPISLISSSGVAIPPSLHRVSLTIEKKKRKGIKKNHARLNLFIVCFLHVFLL